MPGLYPDEVALIELHPGKNLRKSVTWREFDERANRVANALTARGIKKDDKVIHLMMNSIDWLAAYFGIIRTGAWAVPLNFRFTGDEIKYCADIAEARMMIFSEEFTERVVPLRSHLPTIEKYIFAGAKAPDGMERLEDMIRGASPKPPQDKNHRGRYLRFVFYFRHYRRAQADCFDPRQHGVCRGAGTEAPLPDA